MEIPSGHDVRGAELHRLELKISQLLPRGVFFAGLIISAGWLWMWYGGQDISRDFSDYNPVSLVETVQWAVVMNDRATVLTYMGLVILIALPMARVLLTGYLFYKEKDHRLAVMAFAVFGVLILSLFLGIDL